MIKNKIGILYICTGKYSVFWEKFYESAERFLLTDKDIEKHYFVFTDDEKIREQSNIHVYKKTSGGFPNDSLYRFETFIGIEKDLREMDFLFFLNSNMNFIQNVGKEIIPFKENLMGVLHPGFYNSDKNNLPYERNKKSTAFIPNIKNISYHYFMGGFNGGKTEDFLQLCKKCHDNIVIDAGNKVMACFHDESHINRYFVDKNILILPSSYGFAEDTVHDFVPKIIILNKVKHYGEIFQKEYANPLTLESPFSAKNYFERIKKLYFKVYSFIMSRIKRQ